MTSHLSTDTREATFYGICLTFSTSHQNNKSVIEITEQFLKAKPREDE